MVVQLPLYQRGLSALDEGALQNATVRMLAGEILYRDVNTMLAPGIYYLQAVLYSLAGVRFIVSRAAMIVLNAATAALLYSIAETLMPPVWAALPAVVYALLIVWGFPVLTMFNYSPVAMLLMLAVVRLLLVDPERLGAPRLFAVGLLLGLGITCKQNFGFLGAVGAAGTAVLLARRLRALGPLAAGLVIVGLPQLAYYAAHGALSDLVRDTILATLTEQRTYYHHPIPDVLAGIPPEPETGGFLFRYLPPSIHNYVMENGTLLGWKPTRSFYRVVIVLSYYVPIAILAGGAFLALLGRDAPRVRRSARTVAAFAALLFLALFPNTGWAHLLFVLPLVLVLAAWLLFHVGSRLRGCVLLGVALLAGMTIIIERDLCRWYSVPLDTPRGRVLVKPEHAEIMGETIAYIRSVTPPSAEVFVLPYVPIYYFFAERRNPTRYDLVLPGNVGAREEQEIIDVLERKRTEYVLLNPMPYPDFAPFEQLYPRLHAYLEDHYPAERVFRQRWTVMEVRRRR